MPFSVAVAQDSRVLRLTVEKGHSVTVLGYLAEPLLRIDGRGVAVNASSPTAAAAELVSRHDVHAGWERRSGATAVWRDPRLQRLPAGMEHARWAIPLLVDGRRTQIVGELQRVARPALWPWLLLVTALVAGGSFFALGRKEQRLRSGCALLGVVATNAAIVTAAGFAFEAHATGSRVAAVYLLSFAVGGAGVAHWGPRELRVAVTAWLGLVGLTAGLAYTEEFLHGVVLSVLPVTVSRVAAALAVGSGAAACLLGGLFYERRELKPHSPG